MLGKLAANKILKMIERKYWQNAVGQNISVVVSHAVQGCFNYLEVIQMKNI